MNLPIQNKTKNLTALLLTVIMLLFVACKKDEPDVPPPPKPLPKIYINTENGLDPDSRENYLQATFSMTDAENFDMEETSMRIRGRGNTTWMAPKKPWRLNFPTPTSLFGLKPARNWLMLALHFDETYLGNAVAFELGRRLEMPFTNNSFFVELYLNGDFRGVYQVTEHLKSNVGDALSSGDILMELDDHLDEVYQFESNVIQLPVMVQRPESQDALDRAKILWDSVEKLLYAPVYANTPVVLDSDWRKLLDVKSLMQLLLVKEFLDVWTLFVPNSFWVRYVAADGKIHFGPGWDFDQGGFNAEGISGKKEFAYSETRYSLLDRDGLYFWYYAPGEPWIIHGAKFILRFFDDPTFVAEYKQFCDSIIGTGKLNMDRFVDSLGTVLRPSVEKDRQRWGLIGQGDYGTNVIPSLKQYFRDRITVIKNYANQ